MFSFSFAVLILLIGEVGNQIFFIHGMGALESAREIVGITRSGREGRSACKET